MPNNATQHIVVQSGGAVVLRPPSRRVIRRRRVPRPTGTSTLAMGMMADMRTRLRRLKALALEHLTPAIRRASNIVEAQIRLDAPIDEISSGFGIFRTVFFRERSQKELEGTIRNHGLKVNRRTRSTFQRQFKAIMGVDVLGSEPWLDEQVREFVGENVSLITGLEEETLKNIEQLVIRRVRAGDRPSAIASQLEGLFDTTSNRAQLIARDQTLKFHSRLLRLRYEGQGLKRYRWRTVKDQRVRDTHEALDGKVFSFSKPPVTVTTGKRAGERNNPGEDIQCRCFAEPIFEDLVGEAAVITPKFDAPATGLGSRGGHVIGMTKKGNPIYGAPASQQSKIQTKLANEHKLAKASPEEKLTAAAKHIQAKAGPYLMPSGYSAWMSVAGNLPHGVAPSDLSHFSEATIRKAGRLARASAKSRPTPDRVPGLKVKAIATPTHAPNKPTPSDNTLKTSSAWRPMRSPKTSEPSHYTIKGYHTTTVENFVSIAATGLIPGKESPAGQDWLGDYSGKANYFHQGIPFHEIDDGAEMGLVTLEFGFEAPASHVVPDEESGKPDDTPEVLKMGGAIAVGLPVPAKHLQRIHLSDTPEGRAWYKSTGSKIPVTFHRTDSVECVHLPAPKF